MVTAEEVKNYLCIIEQWQPEQAAPWAPLLEDAAAEINRRTRRRAAQGDTRLIRAAAGWAAYQIALSQSGGGEITSFQAGDVSVTAKDAGGATHARRRMEQYFAEAAELLRDTGFAFLEV